MNIRLFASLICCLVVSCASTAPTQSAHRIRGVYFRGFEVNAFNDCETREAWWLQIVPEAYSAFDAALDAAVAQEPAFEVPGPYRNIGYWPLMYIRALATVSERGSYGHLGSYARTARIEKIVEMRPASLDEIRECVADLEFVFSRF